MSLGHHAASGPDELLFAAELAEMQRRHPGLAVSMALSRPAPGWFGYRGRLSRRQTDHGCPGSRSSGCVCVRAARVHGRRAADPLRRRGRARRLSIRRATARRPAPTPTAPEIAGGPTHALRIGNRLVELGASETILQGALRQGIVIPCGCGQGLCGTCRIKGVSGAFDMRHQGGLSPQDEQDGYLLACSTRLTGPAEVALFRCNDQPAQTG